MSDVRLDNKKNKKMKQFNNLSVSDKTELLKFPAYISMLAAGANDKLDEEEKIAAIKLSYTSTFSCDPYLVEFYEEVDKVFEKNIEQLERVLPKEKDRREVAIKKELVNIEKILSKLGKKYVSIMRLSMNTFKEHVSKAHHNVLVDFIFPIPIPGLTE